MRRHLSHVVHGAAFHRRNLPNLPGVASLVARAIRNESAYLRRTRVLCGVSQSSARLVSAALKEGDAILGNVCKELEKHGRTSPGLRNPNYGPVLHAVVRVLAPSHVIETGVAHGCSSRFILEALERNGKGVLHSIELSPRAWSLVPQSLGKRWDFIVGDSKEELPAMLRRIGPIDVFFHDSKHSYEHMSWEFQTCWPFLRLGGLLLSDDITMNGAWRAFEQSVRIKGSTLHRLGFLCKSV